MGVTAGLLAGEFLQNSSDICNYQLRSGADMVVLSPDASDFGKEISLYVRNSSRYDVSKFTLCSQFLINGCAVAA
jgi:hypothetical protein